jgi:hypothetical protein
MQPTTGVIYVASGAAYLDLARASARSLRAVEPDLPVDLFTDDPDAPDLGMFDMVHRIDNPEPRSKLTCMAQTRFERTLFLDADTLVVAPLGDLFDLLERFDCAMAHDVRRASTLVQEGLTEATPYAFPQLNSGVLLYRRSRAMLAFLREWAARFKAAGVGRDQIILKDMLWQSDIRFYVLPPEFNLRRVTMLDAWEPLDARPTILHSHRFMDHMRGAGPRISDPATLVAAERVAHAAEWAVASVPDDALARFDAAQRQIAGAVAPARPAGAVGGHRRRVA